MPNRIIKDTILTSKHINELSDFEFRLWIGLVLLADDDGCGDARPEIIKGRTFPLRDCVSLKNITNGIKSLSAKNFLSIHFDEELKPRYKLLDWETMFPECGRKTAGYAEWRKSVFIRDNYTCRHCGVRGGKLNAHHIKRYRNCVEGRTDIENGITLCEKCHRELHRMEGK